MGKGRIVSGGEDGSYTVELLHNRDRIEAELESLAARLTEMQEELDALNAERAEFVAERNAIATEIDQAIAAAEEGEIPDVDALLVDLAQVSAQIQQQDVRIGMLKGRMLEATKRQEQLESVPEDPQQQAWCADFTEDLTGEVGTVEVPAEGVVGQFATWRRVIIRPAHAGRATYSASRDGQMLHREGQVGYQAYFNAAILPGVQRHKPQYRIGTITSIDREADTCNLTIQGEDASAQALIIDPPDLQYTKTGVPIEYMGCDSTPFEEGDRVLIEFQGRDWDQPKVIGFEDNPKPCAMLVIYRVRYRAEFQAYGSAPECHPAWPGGDVHTSMLVIQRMILLRQTVFLARSSGALASVEAADSFDEVDKDLLESKGLPLAIGSSIELFASGEIDAMIPRDDEYQAFTYGTGPDCVPTEMRATNGIKRMYDPGVAEEYPTWPVSFSATVDNMADPPTIAADLLYRKSSTVGFYVTGGAAWLAHSEEMEEEAQSVSLGTIADLSNFPAIEGMQPKEIVKMLPGTARTTLVDGSPVVDVWDQMNIVVRYGVA